MKKNLMSMTGKVISVGAVVSIEKKHKTYSRRLIGVQSEDEQVVFFEQRKDFDVDYSAGMPVKVDYYFCGSMKGDKVYNNIIATSISVQ